MTNQSATVTVIIVSAFANGKDKIWVAACWQFYGFCHDMMLQLVMLFKILQDNLFWWLRQLFLIGLGGFFVFFGIQLLMAAYRLKDPFSFILTFFASNLIILISVVLVAGFVYRAIGVYTHLRLDQDNRKS